MQAPKEIAEKLQRAVRAWENLAPADSFGGMTLAEFKGKVQEALDIRDAIQLATDQLMVAQNARSDTDRKTMDALLLVVNAIKGNPDHGENSSLYEACGYVRKSERKSGLSRRKQENRPSAGTSGLN